MRAVLTVMKKELWETLRDPMVLIMSLGFPVFFFPLIVWATSQLVVLGMGLAENEPPRVMIQGVEAPGPSGIVDALLEAPAGPAAGDEDGLRSGDLDLIVKVRPDSPGLHVTLQHNSTLPRSTRALGWAEDQLEDVREVRETEIATAAGLSAEALKPWQIESEDVVSTRQRFRNSLAEVVPMLVVMMVLVATVSPAVDIFVGERERGTLETTMVTTTSRWPLILGKTLAASVIGMMGATGNLVAGTITFLHFLSSLGTGDSGALHLVPLPMFLSMVALMGGAVVVSALTFLVIVPARTFKQAQSLSSFVTIGFIALLFTSMNAEGTPSTFTALLPGYNMMHCLREGFRGTLAADFTLITTATNLTVSAVILFAVHRIMTHEGYLFGPEQSGWRDALRSLLPTRRSLR